MKIASPPSLAMFSQLQDLWRRDRSLPAAFLGVLLAMGSAHGILSFNDQPMVYFLEQNEGSLVVFLAGVFLFLVGTLGRPREWRTAAPTAAAREVRAPSRERPRMRRRIGVACLATGVAGVAYTLIDTARKPAGLDGPAVFFPALALLLAGCALLEIRKRTWFQDLTAHRSQKALAPWRRDLPWLLAVLAIWTAGQIVNLDTKPGYFTNDEAMHINFGRNVYADIPNRMSPWDNSLTPYLTTIPHAFFFDLFPDRPFFGTRLFSVLVGTIMLAAFFILARGHLGRFAAWISLALLGSNQAILWYARSGFMNLEALLILILGALALIGAWRSRRGSIGFLTGLLAGLAKYFYYGALLLLPLALVTLGLQWIRDPQRIARRKWIVIGLVVGYGVAAGPYYVFDHRIGHSLDSHVQKVGLLGGPRLTSEMRRYKTDDVGELLVRYAWPAFGGALLWAQPRDKAEYGSSRFPMTDRMTSALLVLGFVGAIALWRRRLILLVAGLWWIGVLAAGWLTIWAPYAPRLLMSLGAGYLLVAWVLTSLVRRAGNVGGRRVAVPLMMGIAVWTGTTAFASMRGYYVDDLNDLSHICYRKVPLGAMEYLRTFPVDAHLVYYGSRDYKSSIDLFKRPARRRRFFREDAKLLEPAKGVRTAYMFETTPQHRAVEREVKEKYPDAETIEIFNPYFKSAHPTHRVYWIGR